MDAYSIFLLDFSLDSTNFVCFWLNFWEIYNLLFCVAVLKQENLIKSEKFCVDRVWVKFIKLTDFPFHSVGEI